MYANSTQNRQTAPETPSKPLPHMTLGPEAGRESTRKASATAPRSPGETVPSDAELSQQAAIDLAMGGTPWERTKMALGALRKLMRDPEQTEMVFVLALTLNRHRIGEILTQLIGTESGNWLLENRPSISSEGVDYDWLRTLPDGTLGREYVRFLDDNELEADFFQEPPGLAPLLGFVAKRMRQSHDVWHTITGYGSDPGGEVELQAFTYAQVKAPSAGLIAVTGSFRALRQEPTLPLRALRAYRRGLRAAKLAPVIWEHAWERPLDELRAELDIS